MNTELVNVSSGIENLDAWIKAERRRRSLTLRFLRFLHRLMKGVVCL